MAAARGKPLVLGFPEYRQAAQSLADAAGLPYDDVTVHEFPDGESRVTLPAALPSRIVFCRSLHWPNGKLIELELAAAAARDLGAEHITLVAPYLCYMRQDKAFHPGEAISQRIIGALLARLFNAVITVDPHLHRTPQLRDAVPAASAIAITAAPVLEAFLRARGDNPLLLGPDAEAEQWVGAIATAAQLDYAVAEKIRLGDKNVRVALPDIDVRGRVVIIIDDVASTGRTLAAAAGALRERGAASIAVLVTHALFAGDAYAHLQAAGIAEICSTDSIPHPSNRAPLAGLLAGALMAGQ